MAKMRHARNRKIATSPSAITDDRFSILRLTSGFGISDPPFLKKKRRSLPLWQVPPSDSDVRRILILFVKLKI
jgi:hypothetical protein